GQGSGATKASRPDAELTIGAFLTDSSAKDTVIAKVDGREVRRSELVLILNAVMRTADPRLRDMPFGRIYDKLLTEVVNGKILANAARQEKMDREASVVAELKAFEDKLLQDRYLDSKLAQQLPKEEELLSQYRSYLAANPPKEEAHARHILVKTEKQASQIIDKLKKGADFKKLADQLSLDKNAKNGGDLGFFTREEMVPEFSAAAFALKPKTLSTVPVKTEYGYHIIFLEEIRQAQPPKLEEIKDQLVNDYMQASANRIIDDLRGKSKIELFTIEGKPIEAPAVPQK
ncbi:MAG: peptidylprolyl isomerase, partial [Alphaproteobacteria bacterium]|nr:peptidylprolyl isomerase [Alphaproteobacteria bacterium]